MIATWRLIVAAAVAAQRLSELWISRTNLRARRARAGRDPAFAGMVAVHVLLLPMALGESAWRSGGGGARLPLEVSVVALGALGIAQLLRLWTMRTMRDAWSVRIAAPARIVTSGPYRYVRHPNYVAVIVE